MKVKRIVISLTLIACLLLGSSVAFAETQIYNPTHDGIIVACKLTVDWYAFSNDIGKAWTSWNGKTSHKIGVYLYQKQSSGDIYHLCDTDTDPKSVYVSAAVAGVWTYQSVHKVYHLNSSGTVTDVINVCTITDW